MRKLVIGDIHGGLKALQQLFLTACITPDDILIFLGDYADGWSETAQLIDFLMTINQQQKCIFLLGNHDTWCRDWLQYGTKNETWLLHGGKATIKSYENYDAFKKEEHVQFFEKMLDYYIDEDNNLFIHAGFTSVHGPKREENAKNCYWDRTLWETAAALDPNITRDSSFYPKRLLLFHEIYIGHTPTLHYKITTPMHKANVWNIDTGAAFTGKLSVLDVDTKEYWQSDCLKDLYPDEKGRNK